MNIKPHPIIPPAAIIELSTTRLKYTAAKTIFHVISVDVGRMIGVFGDGDNGSYEWFIINEDGLEVTSDCGYGSTEVALRDVLEKEFPR